MATSGADSGGGWLVVCNGREIIQISEDAAYSAAMNSAKRVSASSSPSGVRSANGRVIAMPTAEAMSSEPRPLPPAPASTASAQPANAVDEPRHWSGL